MRSAFVKHIESAMQVDSRIVLLTGDLGFGLFENIATKFPTRFYNTGVAEQNMVALASGLSLSGLRPWVYSMPSFLILRAAEFIRNDVTNPGLPICLVGNGAGFAYGPMGASHHAIEDLSLLKSLQGLQIFAPSHPDEVPEICKQMLKRSGPSYLRLHHNLPADLKHPQQSPFGGKAETHVIAFGPAHRFIPETLRKNCNLSVLRSYPLSSTELKALADKIRPESASPGPRILFVEEHAVRGSLSESLAYDLMREFGHALNFRIAGLRAAPEDRSGGAEFLSRIAGLGEEEILGLWSELESGFKTAL